MRVNDLMKKYKDIEKKFIFENQCAWFFILKCLDHNGNIERYACTCSKNSKGAYIFSSCNKI